MKSATKIKWNKMLKQRSFVWVRDFVKVTSALSYESIHRIGIHRIDKIKPFQNGSGSQPIWIGLKLKYPWIWIQGKVGWKIGVSDISDLPYPMDQSIGYTEPNHFKMVLGGNRFESVWNLSILGFESKERVTKLP